MANSVSSRKRIRQNATRNARNRWRLREMRGAIKDFLGKVAHGSVEDAAKSFQDAAAIIDKTAQRGIIHRNQAARRKSRLNAKLKARRVGGTPASA